MSGLSLTPFGGSTSSDEFTEKKAKGLMGAGVREGDWVRRVRKRREIG